MKKSNKELKQILTPIFKKDYVLSREHQNINTILELNTKRERDQAFNKLNVLKLNKDKSSNIKLYKTISTEWVTYYKQKGYNETEIKKIIKSDKKEKFYKHHLTHKKEVLKELDQVKKEVDQYFKRSDKELLKLILKENRINIKADHYTLYNKPLKEIKEEILKEKTLNFSYYVRYNIKEGLINSLNQLLKSFSIILNKKVDLSNKLLNLDYDASREDIAVLINQDQDLFKINIFLDKFKIKFLKEVDHLKVSKVFKDDYFNTFKKKFFIPFKLFCDKELFNHNPIYLLDNVLYYSVELNLKDSLKFKAIPEIKPTQAEFIIYLNQDRIFNKGDFIKAISENKKLNKVNKALIISEVK